MAKKEQDMIMIPLPRTIIESIDEISRYITGKTDRTSVATNLIVRGAKTIQADLEKRGVKIPPKIWLPKKD